jgi:hypothetical protein
MRALLQKGDFEAAVTVGYCALDRFPDDSVVWNGLAEVLKSQRKPASPAGTAIPEGATARQSTTADQSVGTSSGTTADLAVPESATDHLSVRELQSSIRSNHLRVLIRRALNLSGARRETAAQEALDEANVVLGRQRWNVDALYCKGEALLALGRSDNAAALLTSLPEYISTRPDFLALAGRTALAQAEARRGRQFDPEVLESVVKPWTAAARLEKELRHIPAVSRLRASVTMVDGQTLESIKKESVNAVRDMVAATAGKDSRRNRLSRWYMSGVQSALSGLLADIGPDPKTLVAAVDASSQRLDDMEERLVSASRYLHVVAP